MHVHFMIITNQTPSKYTLSPGVIKLSFFVANSFVIIFVSILILSDLFLGVERKIFYETMHYHILLVRPRPIIRQAAPEVMIFPILANPSLLLYTQFVRSIHGRRDHLH